MKKYSVSVIEKTEQSPTAEGTGNCRSLGFEFENHDDLFHIIEKVQASGLFDDRQETVRFCVGLKLFSSVMMSHRDEELFKDFEPAFIGFMKKLKSK